MHRVRRGKIGFVLPAEILQVSYAQPLREFLGQFYNKINIVSFEKLVFPDIQQEVVLLLCEKNKTNTHLIEHLELRDAGELLKLDVTKLKSPKKKIDFKCMVSLIPFLIILLPHLIWLTENNYITISYGLHRTGSGEQNFLDHIIHPLIFLGKQIGILIPFFLMLLLLVQYYFL